MGATRRGGGAGPPPLSPRKMSGEDADTLQGIAAVFSLGHVLNDLCAAMWFTYMLVFFDKVAGLGGLCSGSLMLLGQLADGFVTPLVGIGCDQSAEKADKTKAGDDVRRRLPWHLAGSVMVVVSFPWLFYRGAQFTFGHETTTWAHGHGLRVLWFSIWVVVFQTGWATTQIAHMSLIPGLSMGSDARNCSLNASRYAATVLSTVAVYAAAWAFLGTGPTQGLSAAQEGSFLGLALGITGVGAAISGAFHVSMRAYTRTSGHLLANPDSPKSGRPVDTASVLRMWCASTRFWVIGALYMCTRIIINITQTFLALYVLNSLHAETTAIATVPLVLFVGSLLGTYVVSPVNDRLGPDFTYMLATLSIAAACLIFYHAPAHASIPAAAGAAAGPVNAPQWPVYAAAAVFGVFSSLLMVANTTMVAATIGDRPGSAVVYGLYSLVDKVSCGAIIMVVQSFKPEPARDAPPEEVLAVERSLAWYYRYCIGLLPCVVGVVALAGVAVARLVPNPPTWAEEPAAADAPGDATRLAASEPPSYGGV